MTVRRRKVPRGLNFVKMIALKLTKSDRVQNVLEPEQFEIRDPVYKRVEGFEFSFYDTDDRRWIVRVFECM